MRGVDDDVGPAALGQRSPAGGVSRWRSRSGPRSPSASGSPRGRPGRSRSRPPHPACRHRRGGPRAGPRPSARSAPRPPGRGRSAPPSSATPGPAPARRSAPGACWERPVVSIPFAPRSSGRATTGGSVRDLLPALRTELGDPAAELVPEDDGLVGAAEAVIAQLHRHLGPLVDPVPRVQVGPADPAAGYLDPHLAGPGVRLRQLDQVELGVLAGEGSHRACIHPRTCRDLDPTGAPHKVRAATVRESED